METPSSATRRVTRSQTLAALNNSIPVSKGKNEESEKKSVLKTRTRNGKQKQERSALIDITNDSPIVGLAMEVTPSSAISKRWRARKMMMTPGSGEALLRGQVKTLLQKVEEQAELSKVPSEGRPFLHLQSCAYSPMGILAPTPANTPNVSNLSEDGDGGINNSGLDSIVMALSIVEEQMRISEVASSNFNGRKQEYSLESQKSLITRSLLLDFSEKSESSDSSECYSVMADEGLITEETSASREKPSPDDDNSSIWSTQVNTSTHDEETIEEMGDNYYEDQEEEEMGENGGLVDELCEGLSKICMKEMFTGKHTRFVYNSDDEIEGEEECAEIDDSTDDIIRLKGLPTPKGKHLRFPMNEQDD